jgi:hypothetical protein
MPMRCKTEGEALAARSREELQCVAQDKQPVGLILSLSKDEGVALPVSPTSWFDRLTMRFHRLR